MPTKHIENHTNAPMYVGGKMIPPGSGRDIDVALLPPEHQVHAATVAQAGPSVAELIESLRAQPVKDILADLEGLTQEALGLLHEAEKAQAKPRTSLIAGLEAETMRRADARIKAEEDALYLNQLLDLTPEQLYQDGRILFSRVHADDQQALAHSIWSSTNKLEPWRTVFRVNHPGKGTRWCSAEGLPQAQPDGSVLWHGYVHDVTEARQAAQALDRQHRMLDAVRQAQAAYIEADDKRQAFEGLLKAFLSVTNSAYGFVGEVLYDPQGQPYLKSHAITDISWDEASRRVFAEQMDSGMEFRNLKTLFGHALLTGETVLTNHPETDARRGGLPHGHPPMHSFLGIPLEVGGRLIAMVGLANATDGYREDDVEFLQPLLGTVRQLVLARRGHDERQRSRQQLQATSALLAEKTSALQVTLDTMSQGLAQMDAAGGLGR